ncbi:alkaline phosphatase family protein [Natronococcus wangiae]|uniref:alkaline phosphatase family protein n=1 Tax=Natronococcus wangiae TaxID=3068275 RepID=UPI00387EDE5F
MNTLLIGIDAGSLSVFDDLDEGEIPTIHRLCSDGVSAPLESQIPPWTPSAWPSLYTGVNPGKHGAFGFVGYDGYDWHVTSSDDVDEHTVWSLLDRHGYSSVVVNAPITHPPEEFDGALLPGFIGPENPGCHPEGLLEEVREEIGDYRVYPSYSRDDDTIPASEKMEEYRRLIRMRGDAFRYLADEYEPDFGFVQFQKTDTVFHEFFGDEEKVKTVYETTDEQIAAILEEFDPNHVFVVSDHGMGEYDGYEFRVNEFLRDRGYLETTTGGKGMPSWTPMRRKLREGEDCDTWEPGTIERAAATVADRCGITAHRVRMILERVGLAGVALKYAPGGVARTANEQVDFERSQAYVRARTELGVRINLEGRDPRGVVPQDEYEELREEIIRELEGVETPEGEPVFETVAPRERYFHGDHADEAVDIVMIPTDFDHAISEQLGDEYFGPAEPWNHKLDGVFAAMGEGIDEGADLERTHLFDVAPTIMASFGVPYSDRMDGSVIPVVDSVDSTAYPKYEESDEQARPGADDEVTDRLADLGYMN